MGNTLDICIRVKRRDKRSSDTQFENYFFLAGRQFESIKQQPFLFGDKFDLNFINLTNKPNNLVYSTNESTTRFLHSLVHIRKDTLKLVKTQVIDEYSIEFKFDCDIDVKIEIIYFANEHEPFKYTSTCDEFYKNDEIIYSKGANILFKQENHTICASKISCNWNLLLNKNPVVYPIVIKCHPADPQNTSHCHVTIATLEKAQDNSSYCIKVLKQKQLIDGVVYNLQELFGIEKKTDHSIDSQAQEQANPTNSCVDLELKSFKSSDTQQGLLECVICMSETRDTLLLPCRHMCICNMCANNLRFKTSTCPICRMPFCALLQIQLIKSKSKSSRTYKTLTIYEAFSGKLKKKDTKRKQSSFKDEDAVVPVLINESQLSDIRNFVDQRKVLTDIPTRKKMYLRRSLRSKRKDSLDSSLSSPMPSKIVSNAREFESQKL